ncbi:hypothetical protein [Kitasatospora sp. NBC_01266]|uniref:hypothetical protein n=1 Tax=Kitasatospora sp. NBC_01266 TaxID=2903572 RepID=UPI002E2F8022|nr:hypothetical protein [Kitasatospora sp. NBC_01266]
MNPQHSTEPPAAGRLRRLYPAAYWQQHGEEIAALHQEAREAAGGRVARARETFDLFGHATRVRLGVTSATPAGRALGAAAPYVLVGTAASALIGLVPTIYTPESAALRPFSVVFNALSALALLCAVAGRWTWARLLALVGSAALLVASAVALGPHVARIAFGAGGPVLVQLSNPAPARVPFLALVIVLLLCAPPDLQPLSLRSRWAMLGTAAAIVLPPVAWSLGVPGLVPGDRSPWPVIVMGAVILAALARLRSNPAAVAGALLATLPWFCDVLAYHPAPMLWTEIGAYGILLLVACGRYLTGRGRRSAAEHPNSGPSLVAS